MIKTPNVTIVNTSVDPGLNYLTNQDLDTIRNNNKLTATTTDTSLILNKLEDVIKVINLVTVIDKNAVLSPGGSNGQIQLNLSGHLSGDAGLTYDAVDDKLTTGNLVITTKAVLPEVRNISITGGTFGQMLTTDGVGNLSWTTIEFPHDAVYWASVLSKPTFANVATTGSYTDLANKPTFANVATTGSYTDLANTPSIPSITGLATTTYVDNKVANVAWANVLSKPTFANVATTGSYTDLANTPSIPSITGLATTGYVDTKVANIPWSHITGAPTIPNVSANGQTVIAPGIDSGINLGEGSKIQSFSGLRISNEQGHDISIITTEINVGTHEWTFGTDGVFYMPENSRIITFEGSPLLSTAALQAIVADSADFADFKSRIAAL